MHIIPKPKWFRSAPVALFAVMAILAGYSSKADAQFTYANTSTGVTLTVNTSDGGGNVFGPPVTMGTPTDGSLTNAGTYTSIYPNGNGSYTGGGSAQVSYNLDSTGLEVGVALSGSADSEAGDGDFYNTVNTDSSAGIDTDFMVATTGLYDLTGSVMFGGAESSYFGGLFLTYTVNDDTDHSGFSLDDDL